MKILYFYQYFTTPNGAFSTRVYDFARRWAEAGDCVTVVTTVYDKSGLRPSKLISRIRVDGIDLRVLNIRLSNRHGVLLRLLTFAAYVLFSCWYALTLRADVVICSSPPITVALPGLLARFVKRRRFVFEVRDIWPEVLVEIGVMRNPVLIKAARALERLCYRSSQTVIALSQGIANWIQHSCRSANVRIVSNASDNQMVTSLAGPVKLPDWAKNKHLVLYTGTLGFANNCWQLLDMAAALRQRGSDHDIAVVIIGDGKERTALAEEAERRGLHCLHFLGSLSKDKVMRWLCAASCALLVLRDAPVLGSGSPNKMFDAFAAGTPVIHNTRGWIRDFVDREQCGVSVPPGDAWAMAEAVIAVTGNAGLREHMSANARRVARELFDCDLLAGRMREVLRGCAHPT